MPSLIGAKVKLRFLTGRNVRDLFKLWNDRKVAGQFAGFSPMRWIEFKRWVKGATWFIVEKIDSDIKHNAIGFVSFYLIREDYPRLFEIGYRTKPSERNKGYTTEAVGLVVDYLFEKRRVERIESVTDIENLPSQRVLEKNGFKKEGELRKRSFNRGKYRNEYIYGLLKEEWEKQREPVSRTSYSTST